MCDAARKIRQPRVEAAARLQCRIRSYLGNRVYTAAIAFETRVLDWQHGPTRDPAIPIADLPSKTPAGDVEETSC